MHEDTKRSAPSARTLLDIPANIACRIEWAGQAVRELGYYAMLGLRVGGFARVLARYPEHQPRFVELEVGEERISLPVNLAGQVTVCPL